jgi:hypothetical protein
MNRHHRRLVVIVLMASAVSMWASHVRAAILIPTNQNGADAEVREDADNHMRPNTDPAWGPVGAPRGLNRGTNGELASRIKDTVANAANDRTSAMYMKFDISGITQADLDNNVAALRLTVRNTNLAWNRILGLNPYYGSQPADDTNPEWVAFRDNPANYTRVNFNLYGLKPEPLAMDDPRRFGSVDPTLPVPNYNWIEAPAGDPNNTATDETTWDAAKSPLIGPIGPLTYYNAPGITPDSRTTPVQDAGKFNFNSDVDLLGTFTLPNPPPPVPPAPGGGGNRLPVGLPVEFGDPDGNLHDLIQRAKDNGRTHITLIAAIALNGLQNATGETVQVTPNDMLNFNYLVNPKEIDSSTSIAGLQLNNDNNWDPDGPGPQPPTGSPYSCDGSAGAGLTNCPGHTLGDNTNGAFSPTLVLRIPEPTSLMLSAWVAIAAAAMIRRRN